MTNEIKYGVDVSEGLHAALKSRGVHGDLTRAFQEAVDNYLQSEAFAQHLKENGITDIEPFKPRRTR